MVLFLLALSVGMTLVNLLGQWAGSAMGLNTDAVEKMVYPSLTGLGGHFGVIVSQIAGGWALGMLGYFIGGAYYRMNKIWKIVVSITVPALLVFGLPLLLVAAPAGVVETLGNWFFSAIEWVVRSPYNLALLWLGGTVFFGIFSWLLIRRAPVKIAG